MFKLRSTTSTVFIITVGIINYAVCKKGTGKALLNEFSPKVVKHVPNKKTN